MEQQGIGLARDHGPVARAVPLDPSCAEPTVALHSDWRRELRNTILRRVVPRLTVVGQSPPAARPRELPSFTGDQVERFADDSLVSSVAGLLTRIEDLQAEGITPESILIDLLSPAARRLGDLWLSDRLSFIDVTAGLGRLQAVMRAMGPDFETVLPNAPVRGRRILLAPAPGEQHTFGLSIVAAFFRRGGWDVTFEPRADKDELLDRVRTERFDAVGLSAAGDGAVARMPGQVEMLRRASLARNVTILAGGPAFLADADLNHRIGADAVARDATEAVHLADALSAPAAAA